jgi:hypothetical protein
VRQKRPTSPTYRATIVEGRLSIVDWRPQLLGRGESAVIAEQRGRRGVSLADLTVVGHVLGQREVIVAFLGERMAGESARSAIAIWASATGHYRVWFDDELRELEEANIETPEISALCPTCGTEWCGSREVLERAWANGFFPPQCDLCGGLLPQWTRPAGAERASRGR